MSDYSSLLKWLWFGSGALGLIVLSRNPGKLVFENTFWGSMFKISTLMLMPVSIIGGPITLGVALLLPKKKLCPHCYKVVRKEETICHRCGKPMPLPVIDPSGDSVAPLPSPQFSPHVQAAIAKGLMMVNLPIPAIMFGIWLVGVIMGAVVVKSAIILLVSFPLGFISGWLWWSYSVPRWRKWALQQPGVTPDDLQAAAEAALLVWPKGHVFEKTEFKINE